MTRIVIVNEKDEVIGAKERSEETPSDITRVASLWVTNYKREILLQQRKLTKKYGPGMWTPAVAGTVEEGETYERCIYRESEEELGITGVKFNKGPKFRMSTPHEYFSQVFFCKLDWDIDQFKIEESEIEQIRWFSKEELLVDIKEHPENYSKSAPKILKEINKYI